MNEFVSLSMRKRKIRTLILRNVKRFDERNYMVGNYNCEKKVYDENLEYPFGNDEMMRKV